MTWNIYPDSYKSTEPVATGSDKMGLKVGSVLEIASRAQMTNSIDQVERILQKIVSRLIENYRPEQIILFGSIAYGVPDEDSDIDLLIIKETNDSPLQRRLRVRQIVADPQRKIPFSPLVLTRKELETRLKLGDPFYDEIVHRGKVLYAQ